jgi:transaldolase
MKFFLDTAHLESLKKAFTTGLLNGVTTNPTLLSKEHANPTELIQKIAVIHPSLEISVEVTENDPHAVYTQAHALAELAPNIIVKIPSKQDYLPVIHKLVQEGITLNITLLFSLVQGIAMAKLGVRYVSPFIGRLDDIDTEGMQLVADLRQVFDHYGFTTKILAASIRSVRHIHEAALQGADCITMPVTLFESLLEHPLTSAGIERFEKDWKSLDITKFPQ